MDPTCTKTVIVQNPCNSWNPRLLLEAPKQLPSANVAARGTRVKSGKTLVIGDGK
jgi:hypothetical protein